MKQMVNTTIILVAAVVTIQLAGCCTKKLCATFESVSVRFDGFRGEELDTIYATPYVRGSGFTQTAGATTLDNVRLTDDSVYYFSMPSGQVLEDEFEWELEIPATGGKYRISDYSYSEYACNCPKDKVRSLHGCRVNGSPSGQLTIITK